MNVRLETESGERLAEVCDREGVIASAIPPLVDTEFHCWRFIDPYGATVFNRLQMGAFLLETDVLQKRTADVRVQRCLTELEVLARRCRDEVRLYLKFYGDW